MPAHKPVKAVYIRRFLEYPGCIADGETPEEAMAEGADALESYRNTLRELGRSIPASGDVFGGQWRQRVPKSLHAALARRADHEGVSLNMLVTTMLAEGLGRRIWALLAPRHFQPHPRPMPDAHASSAERTPTQGGIASRLTARTTGAFRYEPHDGERKRSWQKRSQSGSWSECASRCSTGTANSRNFNHSSISDLRPEACMAINVAPRCWHPDCGRSNPD
ncbi:MAG: toxin-antitoxin system HicB family antitoxin [Boseongicola sp. SB0673_bin_14]|nr:toxin-antitoxin system HicB family antitoxin [Boseongicola sp. SB0667_bin_21]MYI69045.1 toxin-antitoxin system HicB family antitoxin [Boseongicola sp. SB0673_bin_14]